MASPAAQQPPATDSSKPSNEVKGSIYEIRVYSFNIKGMSEYLNLVMRGLWKKRASFSVVFGPWKTEISNLCEVVYIAQYDSLTHLLATRENMLGDPEWSQYIMHIADLPVTFRNFLTVLLPGCKLHTDFQPSESAVYELQTIPESEGRKVKHSEDATVVGRFLSVYGPSRTEFCLLRYPDPRTAFTDAVSRRPTLPHGVSTRLMVPVQGSNMK